MEVRRILNNNAALVSDESGAESIVLGKGIGHGVRRGDHVDQTLIDQIFIPDEANPIDRLAAYLGDIPMEVARVAHDIAAAASDKLSIPMSQALILPIADHLAVALERARDGKIIDYPLRWEVSQLYPKELAVGREGVSLANARLTSSLPDDEAVAIALHLVNAAFARRSLNRTFEMTERLSQVLQVVESGTGVAINPDSMSAARFITHLRYLFVRIETDAQFTDSPQRVASVIRESHPQEWSVAQRIQLLLETRGDIRLNHDELLYLTLHISRLVSDA